VRSIVFKNLPKDAAMFLPAIRTGLSTEIRPVHTDDAPWRPTARQYRCNASLTTTDAALVGRCLASDRQSADRSPRHCDIWPPTTVVLRCHLIRSLWPDSAVTSVNSLSNMRCSCTARHVCLLKWLRMSYQSGFLNMLWRGLPSDRKEGWRGWRETHGRKERGCRRHPLFMINK